MPARRLAVLLSALAVTAIVAPGLSSANKHRHKKPAAITYNVDFTGTGTFKSDDIRSVSATGQCSNAQDTVVEKDIIDFNVKYQFSVPKTGGSVDTVKGVNVPVPSAHWTQTSTITPGGCLGGNQACQGSLYPASAEHPPTTGYKRVPEMVVGYDRSDVTLSLASVLDFVVGSDAHGSSGCHDLYGRYHQALLPFSFAHFEFPAARNLSVERAMSALLSIPRSKFSHHQDIKMKVSAEASDLPPSNCTKFSVSSVSCLENMDWQGTFKASPAGK